jgi:hypothetical protein
MWSACGGLLSWLDVTSHLHHQRLPPGPTRLYEKPSWKKPVMLCAAGLHSLFGSRLSFAKPITINSHSSSVPHCQAIPLAARA